VHTSHNVPELTYPTLRFAQYGQMGVQLFFVVSAFTLALSFEGRHEKHNVRNFFIRRFFRIAPTYYVAILFFLLLRGFLQAADNADLIFIWPNDYGFANIVANILLLHHFYEPANNTIVPGGWSVGTEFVFYLLFPWLFTKVNGFYRCFGLKRTLYTLFGVFLILVAIQLLLREIFNIPFYNNSFMYFSILNQLPVFCIGFIAYFLYRDGVFDSMNYQKAIRGFCVFTVLPLLFWMDFRIIPVVSAISFLYLMIIFYKKGTLCISALVLVGRLSFSMYLIHSIFAYQIGSKLYVALLSQFFSPSVSLIILYVFVVVTTLICALFTEKYIEKVGIGWGRKFIARLDVKSKKET
jgi:peptidoglycan/LPS O-acetylase OafA/YrhL